MEAVLLIIIGVPLLIAFALGGLLMIIGVNFPRPKHLPHDIYFEKRKYKTWSARHGWPRASGLFYECGIYHKSLPSETTVERECGCGNLFIGPDHIGAGNPAKVMLYEE